MNLLDIFEGREPHQQAIDKLEQRRIEDLEAKMDDCARRGDKEGFQKCKAERDSYHRVKMDEGSMKQWLWNEAERMDRDAFVANADEYGMSAEEAAEWWDDINGVEESGIGQDIANKTEKMARATPQSKAGAVASTVKNAAKWLAGKGGPGREGPTYEDAYTGDRDADEKHIQHLIRKYHWTRQEAEEHLTSSESDNEKFDEAKWDPWTGGDFSDTHDMNHLPDDNDEADSGKPKAEQFKAMIQYYGNNALVTRALDDLYRVTVGGGYYDSTSSPEKYLATIEYQRDGRTEKRYFKSKQEAHRWAKGFNAIVTNLVKIDNQEDTSDLITLPVILGLGDHKKKWMLKFPSEDYAQKWEFKHKNAAQIQWPSGHGLAEGSQDSKSWMAEIKSKYPNAKFMQAKMPGAPIRAYVDNKVVAEFSFDQSKQRKNTTLDEKKLGQNRPKLGTARDAGKSVRKFRAQRGLEEAGTDSQWSKESDWKAIPKSKSGKPADPRGEVTHLSDVARREAERKADQKKNSNEVAEESSSPRDVAAAVMLKKARAAFPIAGNDAEALALYIAAKEQRDVDRLEHENEYEDAMIARLADQLKKTAVDEGSWGGSGPAGLKTPYAVYTKQNGQVKRVKTTNKIGQPMNTREAEAYVAAMRKRDPARWTHDTVWVGPADHDLDEEQKPADPNEFKPVGPITIVPPKKLKSGETYQDRNKYWQAQGQAPIYKTNESGDRVDPILIKALNNMPDGLASHGEVLNACYDAYAMELGKMAMKSEYGTTRAYIPQLMDLYKQKHGLTFSEAANPAQQAAIAIAMKKAHKKPKQVDEFAGLAFAALNGITKAVTPKAAERVQPISAMREQGVAEVATDYSKRRQRERDVDAGKPVTKQRQPKQTDYQKRRAQDRKDMELGEMDKSQKSPAGWNLDDYDYSKGKWTQGKIMTAKDAVKSASKEFDSVFNKVEPKDKKKEVKEAEGSWIVYDPTTKQIKKRFKTHTAGKSYAKVHGLGFASSEYYFDNIKDQKAIAETVTDVRPGMAKIYNKLAPKIERHRDSFLAGQLYDELEAYAELHGAESEFKRMMNGARNRAHMDYDTNPGGFQNWFWYLPFADEVAEEKRDMALGEGIIDAIIDYTQDMYNGDDGAEVVATALNTAFDDHANVKNTQEVDEEKTRLDPKCWTGKKIGNPKTKVKGGVRVNNCVPAEESYTGVMQSQGITDPKLLEVARKIDLFAKTVK